MFDFGITAPDWAFDCDLIEGIERAAEVGVDGVEFFGWEDADVEEVVETAASNGIEVFGTLAAGAGSNLEDADGHALAYPESHDRAVADVERSIEAAADFDADTLVVTVGQDLDTVDDARQHNAIVRVLRAIAPTAEAHDVTVVIEPLNTRVDHPGYYLTESGEAAEIVEAVDSPNVAMLFDVYHQQVTEGDVIRRLREHVEHVGHVHVADNPGRHEPGTGELNYERIFAAIADLDYDGYVSCEFGPAGDPMVVYPRLVEMAVEARAGR
ncbi:MAG: hydroxypyruvate isomerase family protein [Halanaeroarchaeum sp.]